MSGAVRREVSVHLGSRSYSVRVGAGLLDEAVGLIGELASGGRCILVTDTNVDRIYGERLAGLPGDPLRVVIEAGEPSKTLATVERIYDAALSAGIERSAVVVALGGGVVGDVAGFAAATLLRGLRVVMIPTTLLAQVDSSVGGKTGVNRPQGKNLVGAFHQPSLVIADPLVLETLPEREYRAGLAEVVKTAVILDAELFDLLESRTGEIGRRDPELMTDVVARCVELKAMVVERDEREGGLRRILNYGHTVGHAIEQATDYGRYLHGEAVAMGMVAAARISTRLGAATGEDADRIVRLLAALGLDTEIPEDLSDERLERAMAHDKKSVGGRIAFVVNEGIGRCRQEMIDTERLREWMRGRG